MKCLKPVLVRNNRFSDGKVHWTPVPCGKCIACRVNRSEELSGRITLEYERAVSSGKCCYFLTLTYAPEFLPSGDKFDKSHVRGFLKRYRNYDSAFRYFLCSEYGSEFERQHYHMCLFTDVDDKHIYHLINKLWPYGIAFWKRMHKRSARYISKYVVEYDDRQHSDKPFVQMSQNFGYPDSSEMDTVRRLGMENKPLVYRDVLNRKHPYPRKLIGKSFTYKEKEHRSFSESEYKALEYKHRRLRPDLSFSEFFVWYREYQIKEQEKIYYKSKYLKKK